MTDPTTIAAKLSEAQRSVLIDMYDGVPKWGVRANVEDANALATLGLTTSILTPLGQQVRDLLQEQTR